MAYGMGVSHRFSDSFTLSADIYRTEWDDYIRYTANGQQLNPVTGKPWTEMDLEMFISAVSDTNSMDRRLVAPFIRERLAKEGYTSIPYMNDVEDAGSVSHIMLADRPTGSDAVLRSRFAKFDPAMRASKNISAGVAAGAIGASQYDPDAIEARASKAGKNEFAAGGAVKYDPSAVDRIINQLREVNRG